MYNGGYDGWLRGRSSLALARPGYIHTKILLPTFYIKLIKLPPTIDMDKALAKIRESDSSNFTELAKKYNLVRTTLSRRFYDKTVSRDEFVGIYKSCTY
jgi:hypothetical protein